MLYGKVVRPPQSGAKLVSVNDSAARKLPGITIVRDGEFLGVVAPGMSAAEAAAEALVVKWEAPAAAQPSSKELFGLLKSTAEPGGGGRGDFRQGSVADGLASAAKKVEAEYTVAYIAHVPLEPRAAVAEWEGEKLTVWTGTQRPFGVRSELASAFGIPEARVRVIVPDTGSGYGGKHTGECAVEAARLAKAAGKPVKLVWTREEEFSWAYFRPAGLIEVNAGAGADGKLTAWEFHNYNSGTAAIRIPYEAPNQNVAFHGAKSPLRQGSYRGLAATANHFAREVHMDELALASGADPLAFRLKNLGRRPPARRAGGGRPRRSAGARQGTRGPGLWTGRRRGQRRVRRQLRRGVVDPKDGRVKIERIVTAFECGAIVNPDHLKNQVEGAIVQGIGGALFEAVEFGEGRVLNPRLSEYRVPRFRDIPPLTTVLLDRKDLPSAGAGSAQSARSRRLSVTPSSPPRASVCVRSHWSPAAASSRLTYSPRKANEGTDTPMKYKPVDVLSRSATAAGAVALLLASPPVSAQRTEFEPKAGTPLAFSVPATEGNYDVTVTLGGDPAAESDTTVWAESRRLVLGAGPGRQGRACAADVYCQRPRAAPQGWPHRRPQGGRGEETGLGRQTDPALRGHRGPVSSPRSRSRRQGRRR
jgi:CO/xanthine dehydrogenase Mo-binding subunit